MKIYRLLTIFLALTLCFFFSSCSKTAGPQGAIGLQGPAGPQGLEGNANVQVDTFSMVSSQWLWNSQYIFATAPGSYTEYFTRYHDVTVSAITQSILNNGMVLVYFTPNSENANQWSPLPYEFEDGSNNFSYNIAFETNVGTVRLHYFFVQNNQSATIPQLYNYLIPPFKFKIMVVSGTIAASMQQASVDFGDYKEVSEFIGLSQSEKPPSVN